MVKSKELKLMRKKLEKASRLTLELSLGGGASKTAAAAATNDATNNGGKENSFWSNDQGVSLQLQYWSPQWLTCDKNKGSQRLQEFLDLFEDNMGDQYKKSSWGLDMEEKKAELTHSKARFLVLLDDSNADEKSSKENELLAQDLAGFCHYRFEYDDEESPAEAVLYVYELQIRDKYRCQGLGRRIMLILERMAKDYDISKVMLTVFKQNEQALNFYKKMHYAIDETSPSKFGEMVDYEILSKKI